MNFGIVITGIGIPEVSRACLRSINDCSEVIYSLDLVGRSLTDLGPPELFTNMVATEFPFVKIVTNGNFDNWAVGNQTFNIGLQEAKSDFLVLGHEDMIYHDRHFYRLRRLFDYLNDRNFILHDCRVDSILFPVEHLRLTEINPICGENKAILVQASHPVGIVLRRSCWEEFGHFNETWGLWYDFQMTAEFRLRDWWALYVNMPLCYHQQSLSLRKHDYGNTYQRMPVWDDRGDSQDYRMEYHYGKLPDGKDKKCHEVYEYMMAYWD